MGLFRRKPKKQPLDRIGAFGKLPFTPEFIKSYAGNPFAKAWDQWFQKAYSALHHDLGGSCKQYLLGMPDYQFVEYRGKSKTPYIGCVFNRQDAGGRRYPFVIIREVKNSLAREFAGALPLFYNQFFAFSEYWISHHSGELTMKQLHQAIQDMKRYSYPLERAPTLSYTKDQLQQLTIADLVRQDSQQPHDLLKWQGQHVKWLQHCNAILQAPTNQVIAFPIYNPELVRSVVVFYLQLLHELVDLNQLDWQLYWQYNNDTQPAYCYLSLRRLAPHEWQTFVNPQYRLTNCYNVAWVDEEYTNSSLAIDTDMTLLRAIDCLISRVKTQSD